MTTKTKKIRQVNRQFVQKPRVVTTQTGASRTKQAFIAECNINNIMAKYQRTGAIDHATKHSKDYGFASGCDFRESMELVRKANEMFNELPSKLRNKFDNDASQFLTFVQDDANQPEMRELGLLPPLLPEAFSTPHQKKEAAAQDALNDAAEGITPE
nr:MAG: internal scaffolding protein [Microvirus sp.]